MLWQFFVLGTWEVHIFFLNVNMENLSISKLVTWIFFTFFLVVHMATN